MARKCRGNGEEACQCRNHAAKGGAISYPNGGRVAEVACGASPTEKILTKRKARGTKAQRGKEVATAGRTGGARRIRKAPAFLAPPAAGAGKKDPAESSSNNKTQAAVKRINYTRTENERETSGGNGVTGTAHVTWSAEWGRRSATTESGEGHGGWRERRGKDAVVCYPPPLRRAP